MRVHAVINKKAGTAIDSDPAKLGKLCEDTFQGLGHDITVTLAQPEDIDSSMDSAIATGIDALIVGGGDGTIRTAGEKLLGTQTALGILPLGTVNRLARDLQIPLEPELALRSLASGEVTTIDAADVNGKLFLCNSLMGLPPEIGLERQKLRGQPFLVRAAGYASILKTILQAHNRIELTINDDSGRRRVRALSLAVSNNSYGEQASLVLTRPSLSDGELGLYISKHRSGFGLLWVLARVASGRWKGDPDLDRFTAKKIAITTPRKRLRLSNDGEVETVTTPLVYTIKPNALRVLVPKVMSS